MEKEKSKRTEQKDLIEEVGDSTDPDKGVLPADIPEDYFKDINRAMIDRAFVIREDWKVSTPERLKICVYNAFGEDVENISKMYDVPERVIRSILKNSKFPPSLIDYAKHKILGSLIEDSISNLVDVETIRQHIMRVSENRILLKLKTNIDKLSVRDLSYIASEAQRRLNEHDISSTLNTIFINMDPSDVAALITKVELIKQQRQLNGESTTEQRDALPAGNGDLPSGEAVPGQ